MFVRYILKSYGEDLDGISDDLLAGGLRRAGWTISDSGCTARDRVDRGSVYSQSCLRDRGVILTAVMEMLGYMVAGGGHGREKGNRCDELHFAI